jgi:hypothetical protein
MTDHTVLRYGADHIRGYRNEVPKWELSAAGLRPLSSTWEGTVPLNGSALNATVFLQFWRFGNVITVNLPDHIDVANPGGVNVTMGPIPSEFRPTNACLLPLFVRNAGNTLLGSLLLASTGTITVNQCNADGAQIILNVAPGIQVGWRGAQLTYEL